MKDNNKIIIKFNPLIDLFFTVFMVAYNKCYFTVDVVPLNMAIMNLIVDKGQLKGRRNSVCK